MVVITNAASPLHVGEEPGGDAPPAVHLALDLDAREVLLLLLLLLLCTLSGAR